MAVLKSTQSSPAHGHHVGSDEQKTSSVVFFTIWRLNIHFETGGLSCACPFPNMHQLSRRQEGKHRDNAPPPSVHQCYSKGTKRRACWTVSVVSLWHSESKAGQCAIKVTKERIRKQNSVVFHWLCSLNTTREAQCVSSSGILVFYEISWHQS